MQLASESSLHRINNKLLQCNASSLCHDTGSQLAGQYEYYDYLQVQSTLQNQYIEACNFLKTICRVLYKTHNQKFAASHAFSLLPCNVFPNSIHANCQ